MLNIREQILKVLKIEDVAQHLMGSPISVSASSKWNIVYSSFYSSDTNPSFKISTRLQKIFVVSLLIIMEMPLICIMNLKE